MSKEKKLSLLPPVFLLLGLFAWWLHGWMMEHFVQDPVSGLLPRRTWPEILLLVLTGCVIVGALLLTRRTKMGQGSPVIGGASDLFFAAGILTLLLEPTKGPAVLVLIYKIFVIAAAASLAVSAVMQFMKKKPFFLLTLSPCVLCVLVLMEYYQFFSEVPQLMNYLLGLGAVLTLSLGAYHRMARAAGLPDRPYYFGIGLMAVYFCAAACAQGIYVCFFCGAAVWMEEEMDRLRPAEE